MMSDGTEFNKHVSDEDDEEDNRIPCSRCGKLTYRDPIYDDLCGGCCRAENE